MPLNILFAGTPEFAVPCLNAVATSGHTLAGVWTQPDRPAGRGRQLQASPVKLRALDLGVPVFQPENLKTLEAKNQIKEMQADLMIVVAYGLILPKSVLAMPKHGCWNVHGSILPRWRGAAPIQRAIEARDAETGVCLMQMETGLDTGPVLHEIRTAIGPHETAGELHDRLAQLGSEAIRIGLQALASGKPLPAIEQASEGVRYAHKIEKSEGVIDWDADARDIDAKVRAFHPWPICEAELAGERVRVHAGVCVDASTHAGSQAGGIVRADAQGIEVQCGHGVYRITQLQRAGGKVIRAADYLNARHELRRAVASS